MNCLVFIKSIDEEDIFIAMKVLLTVLIFDTLFAENLNFVKNIGQKINTFGS